MIINVLCLKIYHCVYGILFIIALLEIAVCVWSSLFHYWNWEVKNETLYICVQLKMRSIFVFMTNFFYFSYLYFEVAVA